MNELVHANLPWRCLHVHSHVRVQEVTMDLYEKLIKSEKLREAGCDIPLILHSTDPILESTCPPSLCNLILTFSLTLRLTPTLTLTHVLILIPIPLPHLYAHTHRSLPARYSITSALGQKYIGIALRAKV